MNEPLHTGFDSQFDDVASPLNVDVPVHLIGYVGRPVECCDIIDDFDALQSGAQAVFVTQVPRNQLNPLVGKVRLAVVGPIHRSHRTIALGQIPAKATSRKAVSACH